jgi:chromate reductase
MQPITVLGFAGSLREKSYNRALLRAARELAPDGMSIAIAEIGDIPLFDEDVEAKGDPEPVARFKKAIAEADGLLIVTPEYNYGTPGVLKNAIDWASRPPVKSVLNEKPAAIMGATIGSTGTARAQLQLRQAFVFTRTHAMLQPEVLVARAQDKFDAELRLTDERTREHVRKALVAFGDWVRRFAR